MNWKLWTPVAEEYIKKGETGHLLDLIDPRKHTVIFMKLFRTEEIVRTWSNQVFLDEMTRVLRPISHYQVMYELKKLKEICWRDTLYDYIGSFQLIMSGVEDNVRPSEAEAVGIFFDGLNIDRKTMFFEGTFPKTLADAYERAIEIDEYSRHHSDETKKEWPELLGLDADEAVRILKEQNPTFMIVKAVYGAFETLERCNERVKVHYNRENNKVYLIPKIG